MADLIPPVAPLGHPGAAGPVRVRPATEADRAAILRVHVTAIADIAQSGYTAAQLDAWMAFPAPESHDEELRSGHVFVAEIGGRIVGYGRFDDDTGEVEATYVLPGAQGQGVGAALLAEAEARARRRGLASMFVSASLNAVGFYQRAGFEPQVTRAYVLSGGQHLECMYMTRALGA